MPSRSPDRGPGRRPKALPGNGDNTYPQAFTRACREEGCITLAALAKLSPQFLPKLGGLAERPWQWQIAQPGSFTVIRGRLPLARFRQKRHVSLCYCCKGLEESPRPPKGR